ncbi:bifunctional phosphoribosyl-AMP cyclohydrolase/phosphoribosyl-ATP diphosphatase HisIE [Flavobacteriaceae bacterium]|jgi:phosphoribosyl-AMP cyclohydrolase / phosphoribosyl-ATP pyrophosphohydrolase|nr:bifunctional phosphoribosyl-AMP cyclohydrolase/phosphoribosyl-ATP diphosphatase HisIE [Flavobacteriaceae bacterium]|tara:strand:- start:412 stop:1005 length:594 start_codon:yes stop_codon:yes gene_type:complete
MNLDFNKNKDGLVPAIIQDYNTYKVLMLGYLNKESLSLTLSTDVVHFYSRTKQRIWKKGEESGNELKVVSLKEDCDNDTLLIKVNPVGPVCHKGDDTCFEDSNMSDDFIITLENIIQDRKNNPSDSSYVSSLFKKGTNKIAQKVGEEAVELVIEAKDDNDDLFLNESADLMFHYLILLQEKGFKMKDVVKILRERSL